MMPQFRHIKVNSTESTFSNPICEKTFVALPKIYKLKNGAFKNNKKIDHLLSLRDCKACIFKQITEETQNKRKQSKESISIQKNNKNDNKKHIIFRYSPKRKNHSSLDQFKDIISHYSLDLKRKYNKGSDYSKTKFLPKISLGKQKLLLQNNQTQISFRPSAHKIFPIKQESSKEMSQRQNNHKNIPMPQNKYRQRLLSQRRISNTVLTQRSDSRQTQFYRSIKKQISINLKSQIQSCQSSRKATERLLPIFSLNNFVQNYVPINPTFDLKGLSKKENFKIVHYKNSIYLGQFVRQKTNGFGLLITNNFTFEGIFLNGQKYIGSQQTSQGIYFGQMVKNHREGQGIFQWKNGESYEGQWKQGLKHGKGIWKGLNGDSYEGDWNLNMQEGYGVHKHSKSTYEGYFQNFLKHGKGKQFFINGDQYQGQYFQGKPNGYGKYKWANGNIYQGQFSNGNRQGHGVLIEEGNLYQGNFHNDLKNGFGKIKYSNGKIYSGNFIDDNQQILEQL